MATWHAYAKLRQHTEYTLHSFEAVTRELGNQLRCFSQVTCPAFQTKELPGETAACGRRKFADQKTHALSGKPPQDKGSSAGSGKTFSLLTSKVYALGDYPSTIRWLGATDSYSTQKVFSSLVEESLTKLNLYFQSELQHHRVKSCFTLTNKNHYARQIAKLERKERFMRRLVDDCRERYGSKASPRVLGERGSPTTHHHIAARSTDNVDHYEWIY